MVAVLWALAKLANWDLSVGQNKKSFISVSCMETSKLGFERRPELRSFRAGGGEETSKLGFERRPEPLHVPVDRDLRN